MVLTGPFFTFYDSIIYTRKMLLIMKKIETVVKEKRYMSFHVGNSTTRGKPMAAMSLGLWVYFSHCKYKRG